MIITTKLTPNFMDFYGNGYSLYLNNDFRYGLLTIIYSFCIGFTFIEVFIIRNFFGDKYRLKKYY